jgi:hypothetical protein
MSDTPKKLLTELNQLERMAMAPRPEQSIRDSLAMENLVQFIML